MLKSTSWDSLDANPGTLVSLGNFLCMLKRCDGVLSGFVSGIGGVNSSFSSDTIVIKCYNYNNNSKNADNCLNLVPAQRVFGSFRHAPLLAQIGFIMLLRFGTIWPPPVGSTRFLTLGAVRGSGRQQRQQWSIVLPNLFGWGDYLLLCSVNFWGI